MNVAEPTVLHVEDDANDRALLRAAFRRAGVPLQLQGADDGEAAVAYLAGDGEFADRDRFPMPMLVLLDLKMPRKSGFELVQWVRGKPRLSWLPLVIFSSSKSEDDIRTGYRLGVNSYLVKPVMFDELIAIAKDIHHYWFVVNHLCPRD